MTQSTSTDPDYAWVQTFPAGQYDKIAVVVVGMGKGGSYKINIKPKTKLSIGDTWQGGIIFYLDGSGEHGLVAAPSDQSAGIVWGGCTGFYGNNCIDTGTTATAVGAGQANTNKIIAAMGAGDYAAQRAANLVLNGYNDWFLPSKDELNLMYWNIGPGAPAPLTNIGGLYGYYWSSSLAEGYNDLDMAWTHSFAWDGAQHPVWRQVKEAVRASRAF